MTKDPVPFHIEKADDKETIVFDAELDMNDGDTLILEETWDLDTGEVALRSVWIERKNEDN